MLVNLNAILKDAYKNKYAIGAYNAYNYETMASVARVAHELDMPFIITFAEEHLENMSFSTAYSIANSLVAGSGVLACLHLDYCTNIENVYKAIRAGFGSVMYDGSALSFEENIANTKEVCKVAKACGLSVEAKIDGLSNKDNSDGTRKFTDPALAKQFVEETDICALSVSIGTVRGMYQSEPNIRTDILKEINKAVNIPLALHGGSGTPEPIIKECIQNGIAKISVNTEISMNVMENTKKYLQENPNIHYSELSKMQNNWAKEVVRKYCNIFENN